MPIFNQSIRRKIVGIALGLIVLMLVTSILSMVMSSQVGILLDELTNRYIPAYGDLARANIRSLERAVALRRMVMMKMQSPTDEEAYAARLREFEDADRKIEEEAESARKHINAIIDDTRTPSDNAALARIETRIETAVTELRRDQNEDHAKLLKQIDANQMVEARGTLEHIDALRDQFNQKIDAIRSDMLKQVFASTSQVISHQRQAIIISGIVTLLAAVVGFAFALLVSSGITRLRIFHKSAHIIAEARGEMFSQFSDLGNNGIRLHHQSPVVPAECKSREARSPNHGIGAQFVAASMDWQCACSST